jgi:hypothetical protein
LNAFLPPGPAIFAQQAGGDDPDIAAVRDLIQRVQVANNWHRVC